jgi:outer membrane protein TolC
MKAVGVESRYFLKRDNSVSPDEVELSPWAKEANRMNSRPTTYRRSLIQLVIGFLCLWLGEEGVKAQTAPVSAAQDKDKAKGPVPEAPEKLPAPRPTAEGLPIDFPSALRLARTTNLDILQAREVVNQFQARYEGAHALFLPSLNVGSTYAHHEGQIQKTEGNIITANKDSLWAGGGPSLIYSLSDAIFAPLAARQLSAASEAGLQRVSNDTYLAVSDAYFNMLRARRRLARIGETLKFLTQERIRVDKTEFKGLQPLLRDYVEVGAKEAFKSELARVEVEVLRRREEEAATQDDYRIAMAELARLIRLDPATPLEPAEDFRTPIPLPGAEWEEQPLDALIAQALASRPELAENRALVQAAWERLRAAHWRPFLPNAVLNYNWGGFGGGPDLNPPILTGKPPKLTAQPGFGASGEILRFNTRTDFDVTLVWRLQNLGFGNRAEIREQESIYQQAQLRDLQVADRVVTQVVQAQDQLLAWRQRLNITRSALFNADGSFGGPVMRSLQLNFDRIKGAEGRPLEVLDSIRGLSDTLDAYGEAVSNYERSRIRLLVSLGIPLELWELGNAPRKEPPNP